MWFLLTKSGLYDSRIRAPYGPDSKCIGNEAIYPSFLTHRFTTFLHHRQSDHDFNMKNAFSTLWEVQSFWKQKIWSQKHSVSRSFRFGVHFLNSNPHFYVEFLPENKKKSSSMTSCYRRFILSMFWALLHAVHPATVLRRNPKPKPLIKGRRIRSHKDYSKSQNANSRIKSRTTPPNESCFLNNEHKNSNILIWSKIFIFSNDMKAVLSRHRVVVFKTKRI